MSVESDYLDDIVTQEALFEMQEIAGDDSFNELLAAILLLMLRGDGIKSAKAAIKSAGLERKLLLELKERIEFQYRAMTGVNLKGANGLILNDGRNLSELVSERINALQRSALSISVDLNDLIKLGDTGSASDLIKSRADKETLNRNRFIRDVSRNARNYGYNYIDEQGKIIGWLSVAILDASTSAICLALNDEFYSSKDYKDRMSLPYLPPRHPNCRTIILAIYGGMNVNAFKVRSLDEFLRRNKDTAIQIMGKIKYNLWSSSKIKAKSLVDISGKRFFTNKQIEQRLKKD